MARLSSRISIPIATIWVIVMGSNCERNIGVVAPSRYPFSAIGWIEDSSDQQVGEPKKGKDCRECGDGGVVETKDNKPNCGCCCCGCKRASETAKDGLSNIQNKIDSGTQTPPRPYGPKCKGVKPIMTTVGHDAAGCKPVTMKHEYHIYLNLGGQAQLPLVVSNNVNDAGISSVDAGITSSLDAGASDVPDSGVCTLLNSGASLYVDGGQGKNDSKESASDRQLQVIHYQTSGDAPSFFIVNTGNPEKAEKTSEVIPPTEALKHLLREICNAWLIMSDSIRKAKECTICSWLEIIQAVFTFIFSLFGTLGTAGAGTILLISSKKLIVDTGIGPFLEIFKKVLISKKDDDSKSRENVKTQANLLDADVISLLKNQQTNKELSHHFGISVPLESTQALTDLMNFYKSSISDSDWYKIGKYLRFHGDKIKVDIDFWKMIKPIFSISIGLGLYAAAMLMFVGAIIASKGNSGFAATSILVACLIVALAGMVYKSGKGCCTAYKIKKIMNSNPVVSNVKGL